MVQPTRTRKPARALEVAMQSAGSSSTSANARRQRPWRTKFRDAFRGLKLGVRGHSSFFVHFFCAALVIAAAAVLRCGLWEWCVLLLCIGVVLTAELFNSAIETMFRGLDDKTKGRSHEALDIAAGGVLVASLAAAIVGSIVFINRLAILFGWGQ